MSKLLISQALQFDDIYNFHPHHNTRERLHERNFPKTPFFLCKSGGGGGGGFADLTLRGKKRKYGAYLLLLSRERERGEKIKYLHGAEAAAAAFSFSTSPTRRRGKSWRKGNGGKTSLTLVFLPPPPPTTTLQKVPRTRVFACKKWANLIQKDQNGEFEVLESAILPSFFLLETPCRNRPALVKKWKLRVRVRTKKRACEGPKLFSFLVSLCCRFLSGHHVYFFPEKQEFFLWKRSCQARGNDNFFWLGHWTRAVRFMRNNAWKNLLLSKHKIQRSFTRLHVTAEALFAEFVLVDIKHSTTFQAWVQIKNIKKILFSYIYIYLSAVTLSTTIFFAENINSTRPFPFATIVERRSWPWQEREKGENTESPFGNSFSSL